MTYSILGFDPVRHAIGAGVASRSVGVGGTVTCSRWGVGVVHTQNHAHLSLGQEVLDRMEAEAHPQEALDRALRNHTGSDRRQLIAIDSQGRVGSWSGAGCHPIYAEARIAGCICAGNRLASRAVVSEMASAFHANASEGGDLATGILRALEAGERAGGDRNGRQAAALRILPAHGAKQVAINLDLRVDDHPDPLSELQRLRALFRAEFEGYG